MPAPVNHPITIDANGYPSSSNVTAAPGDTVTWTNNSSQSISITYTTPTCFTPPTSSTGPTLTANGGQGSGTINGNAQGNYSYGYSFTTPGGDTRGGTIVVS